jgi:hypothetical protein
LNDSGQYSYTAFGLICQSDFALPELVKACGSPDVLIHTGVVPENLKSRLSETDLYLTEQDQFIMKFDKVATYLVRNGNEIIVEPAANSDGIEVRLFIYSACFGALLHQRGLLVLHASAIQTDNGAVLFTGTSGVGKSTLLNLFLQRGYTMLSDDISAVTLDPQKCPLVFPAIPRNKLWSGIAAQMGYDLNTLPRQRQNEEKHEIDTRGQISPDPVHLSHVYELNPIEMDGLQIDELDKLAGFKLIIDNIFHPELYNTQEMRVTNLRLASMVARHSATRRISGWMDFNRLDEFVDLIEEDFSRS